MSERRFDVVPPLFVIEATTNQFGDEDTAQ